MNTLGDPVADGACIKNVLIHVPYPSPVELRVHVSVPFPVPLAFVSVAQIGGIINPPPVLFVADQAAATPPVPVKEIAALPFGAGAPSATDVLLPAGDTTMVGTAGGATTIELYARANPYPVLLSNPAVSRSRAPLISF